LIVETLSMRIVIKLGTSTITGADGRPDCVRLARYAAAFRRLRDHGHEPILVSSGAVAAGRALRPDILAGRDVPHKQMLAALGQPVLMSIYRQLFGEQSLDVAQVLLTHADVEHRRRYLNARTTLIGLLEAGIVPIVNENDTLATAEIRVGDNDQLAALIAGLIDAPLLILMTDQAGLYDEDPRRSPTATLITRIEDAEIPEPIRRAAGGSVGQIGTGGMRTKLRAAEIARRVGTAVVIAHGADPDLIDRITNGEDIGTRFAALIPPREARKRYILSGSRTHGAIHVDAGAATALADDRSLLVVGVSHIDGAFDRGDTVEISSADRRPIARGIANYNAGELARIAGRRSSEIEKILGYGYGPEAVHRDDLVRL
jgi:glutamate 5-kinase